MARSWQNTGFEGGGFINCLAVSPRNSQHLVCGGEVAGFHVSNDGGSTWIGGNLGLSTLAQRKVAAVAFHPLIDNVVYGLVGDGTTGGFCVSLDGGLTWSVQNTTILGKADGIHPRATGNLIEIDTAHGFVYIGSYKQGVYRAALDSTGNPSSFTLIGLANTGGTSFYYVKGIAIDPTDPDHLIACTNISDSPGTSLGAGHVYRSTTHRTQTVISTGVGCFSTELTGSQANTQEVVIVPDANNAPNYYAAVAAGIYRFPAMPATGTAKTATASGAWTQIPNVPTSAGQVYCSIDGMQSEDVFSNETSTLIAGNITTGTGPSFVKLVSTDDFTTTTNITLSSFGTSNTNQSVSAALPTRPWWHYNATGTWMPGQPGYINGQMTIDPNDGTGSTFYAAGIAGVWATSNGGLNWFPQDRLLNTGSIAQIVVDPKRPQSAYFASTEWIFGFTSDLGQTFVETHPSVTGASGLSIAVDGNTTPSTVYLGIGSSTSDTLGDVYSCANVQTGGAWSSTGLGTATANLPVTGLTLVTSGSTSILYAAVSSRASDTHAGIWRKVLPSGSWTQMTITTPANAPTVKPMTSEVTNHASFAWRPGSTFLYMYDRHQGVWRGDITDATGTSWKRIYNQANDGTDQTGFVRIRTDIDTLFVSNQTGIFSISGADSIVTEDGATTTSLLSATTKFPHPGVIAIDPVNQLLYAHSSASSGVNSFIGYASWALPTVWTGIDDNTFHTNAGFCNHLAVGSDGTVWAAPTGMGVLNWTVSIGQNHVRTGLSQLGLAANSDRTKMVGATVGLLGQAALIRTDMYASNMARGATIHFDGSTGDPNYDAMMADVATAGATLLPTLRTGSSYSIPASDGIGGDPVGSGGMQGWYEFVTACCNRYAPGGSFSSGSNWSGITSWEIWNEPNGVGDTGTSAGGFSGSYTLDQNGIKRLPVASLYSIITTAALALRTHGQLHGWTPTIIAYGSNTIDLSYLQALIAYVKTQNRSLFDYIDAFSIHMYMTEDPNLAGGATAALSSRLKSLDSLRNILDTNQGAECRVWFTEGGYAGSDKWNQYQPTFNAITVPAGSAARKVIWASKGHTTAAVAPAISSFTPTTGGVGTVVTITGSGLTGVSSVRIGGTPAPFSLVNDSTVTITIPSASASGVISLTTPGGTATSSGSFTVSPPNIVSFSPLNGPVGTQVTISGQFLTGTTSVTLNGVSVPFTVVNDSTVTFTVPSGASSGPIALTNPAGGDNSGTAFTVTIVAGGTITQKATVTNDAAAATVSINGAPPGTANNDVLVAHVGLRNANAVTTVPAGWVLAGSAANDNTGDQVTQAIYTKIVSSAATELGATYTWGATGATAMAVHITGFSGVDTTTPIVGTGVSSNSGGKSITTTLGNVATVPQNALALGFATTSAGGRPWADSGCILACLPDGGPTYLSQSAMTSFETALGQGTNRVAMGHSWTPWSFTTSSFPPSGNTTGPNADMTANRMTFISWPNESTWPDGGGTPTIAPSITLGNIASGQYDTILAQNALALKNYGHPMWYRVFCEMEGSDHPWEAGWEPQFANGNLTNYTTNFNKAWQRIWTITKGTQAQVNALSPAYTGTAVNGGNAVNAKNVLFHWNPTNGKPTSVSRDDIYPGDAYVDFAGNEAYVPDTPISTDLNQTYDSTPNGQRAAYTYFTQNGKLIGSGEAGNRWKGSGDTSACVSRTNTFGAALQGHPAVKVYSWWNGGSASGAGLSKIDDVTYPATVLAAVQNFMKINWMKPNLQVTWDSSNAGAWSQQYQTRRQVGANNNACYGSTMLAQMMLTQTQQAAGSQTVTGFSAPLYGYANWASQTVALRPTGVVQNQPPVITSFTPTTAAVGATITINGSHFTGTTAITFGGASASTFTVVSDSKITVTLPTAAANGVIAVTAGANGTGTSSTSFLVTPQISSFTPTSGGIGSTVAVAGSGFIGATKVTFNGITASFTVASANSISTTVPAGATSGAITVVTPAGTATSGSGSLGMWNTTPVSGTPGFYSSAWTSVNSHAGRTHGTLELNGVVYVTSDSDHTIDTDGTDRTTTPYLAAYNLATNAVITTWRPAPNATCWEIMPSADGTKLYVGGEFTTICGQTRKSFAILTALSGPTDTSAATLSAALPADPGIVGGVTAICPDESRNRMFLAGGFSSPQGGILRMTLSGGVWSYDSTFTGSISGMSGNGGTFVRAAKLKPDGSIIVCGGNFTGTLAAFNASTGATAPWAYSPSNAPGIYAIDGDNTVCYQGGGADGGNAVVATDWTGSGPNAITVQNDDGTSGYSGNMYWYRTCDGNVQATALCHLSAYGDVVCCGHHGDRLSAGVNQGTPNTQPLDDHGFFAINAGTATGTGAGSNATQTDGTRYGGPPNFGSGADSSVLKVFHIRQGPSGNIYVGGDFTNVDGEANDLHRRHAVFLPTTGGGGTGFTVTAGPIPQFDPTTPFTPTIGKAGDTITINGTNLTSVTGVKFNGISANFQIVSSPGSGYAWSKGADWGGGFMNMLLSHPSVAGTAVGLGDYWGVYTTSTTGASWIGSMNGVAITTSGVSSACYGRAAGWSIKDPTTAYVGTGGLVSAGYGSGDFARIKNGTFTASNTTTLGFGTSITGAASTRPRPGCGRLIQVDYDSGTGTEYVYGLMTTSTGGNQLVMARSTDAGANFTTLFSVAVNTSTPLVAWKSSLLLDSNTLLMGTYRDPTTDGTATASGTILYKITSGSGTLRTATSQSQLTVTTIGGQPGVINDMVLSGTTVYAACGDHGVWTATSGGTVWTAVSGNSFFNGFQVSSIDMIGTHIAVGIAQDNSGGHSIAISNDSGATWNWVTLGGGSGGAASTNTSLSRNTTGNVCTIPWGTSNEWWLLKTNNQKSFFLYLGGNAMDIQQISYDRTDATGNTIYAAGGAGAWATKTGGTTWRPAVIGLNGGELQHVFVGAGGASYSDNNDYVQANTSDHWATCNEINSVPTGFVNTGLADKTDGSGATYHLITTTGAADIQKKPSGGSFASIADSFFKGTFFAPRDFQVSSDGYVYIVQNAGGVLLGVPGGGGSTTISATVPVGVTTGPISLIAPGGTAVSTTNFTARPPTVTSYSPTSAAIGATVTITGQGFSSGNATNTQVKFNGTTATFTIVSDTSISATVPSGATTGAITVTNPNGAGTGPSFTVGGGGGGGSYPITIVAVGDTGNGASTSNATGKAMSNVLGAAANPGYFFYLGDTYTSATTANMAHITTSFYFAGSNIVKSRSIATPGNHDNGDGSGTTPVVSSWLSYWTNGTLTGQNITSSSLNSVTAVTWTANVPPNIDGLSGIPNTDQYLDIGGWRFFFLNDGAILNANAAPGWPHPHSGTVDTGATRYTWLQNNLQANMANIIINHHPRYSLAGQHFDNTGIEALWKAIWGKAVAILHGHDHSSQIFKTVTNAASLPVGSAGYPTPPANWPGLTAIVAGQGQGTEQGTSENSVMGISNVQFANMVMYNPGPSGSPPTGFLKIVINSAKSITFTFINTTTGGNMTNSGGIGGVSATGSNSITITIP